MTDSVCVFLYLYMLLKLGHIIHATQHINQSRLKIKYEIKLSHFRNLKHKKKLTCY